MKWYQKPLGIIVLLFLFFPVGLFLMWKYSNWSKQAKWTITGVFAVAVFLMLIIPQGPPTEQEAVSKVEPKKEATISAKEKAAQEIAAKKKTEEEKSAKKELQILAEQKEKGEQITKQATELITQNKMSEVKSLYKNRWDELAKLRVEVLYDKELTKEAKANIDNALKSDQEGITKILSTYEGLYE